jgi:ferrous iron transport protein B
VANESDPVLFAVAGNPNSGKTTLFNRLTGLRQKVANYPGVTVERVTGEMIEDGVSIGLVDLPGIYSLSRRSEEERIASDVITGRLPDTPPVGGVLCVLDATNLQRGLYLVLQVMETRIPVVVVLNMMDELAARGGRIDLGKLGRILGVPVQAASAVQGAGIAGIRRTLLKTARRTPRRLRRETGGEDLKAAVRRQEAARRIAHSVTVSVVAPHALTERVDDVVLHPVAGPLMFLGVVLVVFQSIFTWARPLMEAIDHLFGHLGRLAGMVPGPPVLHDLLQNGVIAGVGSVVIFLPQILILFFFIGFLEHVGYMARAAFVMDRFMAFVGLQGKSFLPLLSSYACAVPGIMATRTIEDRNDRIATLFVAPFITCSARLPVYLLLIGAFVPDRPVLGRFLGLRALTLIGLYVLGFAAAVTTAWILKSRILRSDGSAPFLLEMPPYRLPSGKTLLLLMWDRSRIFLRRAGTIILAANILLWALASFPAPAEGVPPEEAARGTYAGRIGVLVEPVLSPLGFDWKIGVGLLSAQAAREVLVSTLATLNRIDKGSEEAGGLEEALRRSMTPASAFALLVFFVFALQCTSTLAIARRETGGWRWPMTMLVSMTLLGYGAAFLTFQGARLLGF